MAVKRKDFQKAAAFLHEFLLKLNEDSECAELRDTLNLALLQLQKYYRLLQNRIHEKNAQATSTSLSLTARGLSPMTPFVDAPDKFQWRWMNLDSLRSLTGISNEESINFTRLPPIIQAVKEGNFEMCVELIQNDISCIEEQDGIGRTALIYAVHFDVFDILKCLLESGVEVNATAHDGSTALHQACHDANHKALSMLLQYGGDFTMQDTQGRAPIHWAVTTKSTECLKYLIGHNADVNSRDKDGLSPCMWACRLDHIKHFELLSSSSNFNVDDADGIERDNNGRTWMHWSIRRSEPLECLQTLLTQETAAIRDEDGKTVLLLAAEMGSLLACKIIVEIGGNDCIYDRDNQERTALHLASVGGHGDIVNYLLDHGADLSAIDKFSANAWDYAKNRQLHYVQLIIMSHQRQRLQSNPTSPIPNGLGFSLMSTNGFMGTLGSMNGDHNGNEYEHMINTGGSFDSMPITPPHPPKRPRTERRGIRTPMRRSTSLVSAPEREPSFVQSPEDRYTSSAGGELNRRKERLDVSVNTRNTPDILPVHGDDVPMVTDDNHEDEIDDVSAGGMDVSDIDDDDEEGPPQTSRLPRRQEQIQPRPPPRQQPQQQQQQQQPQPQQQQQQQRPSKPLYAQPLEPQYNRKSNQGFPQDGNRDYRDPQENRDYREAQRQQQQPPSPPKFPLSSNTRVISPHFNQSMNPSESFPPSRPRPAPRQPQPLRNTPPRPPPPRPTPSPARPSSGARDQLQSPPTTDQMRPTPPPTQDPNRPNSSGSRQPGVGVVEGRRIPPPMLTPLENAPVPPSVTKMEKREKKKKRKRKEREREKDKEREADLKSPPMDLEPPRGYAAPLHPPPSATVRQQRAQSGVPAPRFSKQPPQRHESRYVDENMDDDHSKEEESSSKDPPVVNGYAVPMREGPARSARPGQSRLQPMESEEYEDDPDHEDEPSDNRDHSDHRDHGDHQDHSDQRDHSDHNDQRDHRDYRDHREQGGHHDYRDEDDHGDVNRQEVIDEEEDAGPLIPPPQGFRGGNSRPSRPLVSQSIPQLNKRKL
ncbi:espin-like isoform X2 [Mizuhopecten yessoensis]|uniref:espin-like isoform X2 n=1 Tax=Mizuhopecten yessoensis TaxID=6573 RepID=UPI000B45AF7E|nr:espin-like isoform X2 [Mizuhopecten yessoensis]